MKKQFAQQRKTYNSGFTLIEMLVSISLFAVVITMGVGTLLVIIDANGRAQSMQLVMTNFSFALDSMTREIRTGTNWYCDTSVNEPSTIPSETSVTLSDRVEDCTSGGNYISISESGNSLTNVVDPSRRITYWFDEDADPTDPDRGAIKRCLGDTSDCNNPDDWVRLTGAEIDVDEMILEVRGTERLRESGDPLTADQVQPVLTMYIKGKAGFEMGDDASQVREFELQTSITQRSLDL